MGRTASLQMNSIKTSLSADELGRRRAQMVEVQLRRRGIRDERVLAAMSKVPREKFVAPEFQEDAYSDAPLPIGSGQTISQPFMVATMLEVLELRCSDHVLEVGRDAIRSRDRVAADQPILLFEEQRGLMDAA